MSKNYYSLGLMSGTSGDGVDASLINSDGETNYKVEINKYFGYENNFSQNDFQKKKNRIDFDVILSSLGSLEFRVMPLCQGEIVFSEITFRKTNIVN